MSVSPFPAVAAQPDLAAQEHRTLDFWRERAIFAKLRAQNAGGQHWSFIDGPITANNPMGVHHAWGRAYKDAFQRYHAMLGHDQRWQNGFDCQGLWVEVNVERELGFTSKKDIESFGIADFVRLCKQRVLTYAAVQTEQSIRLGYWMDWNDPDELRRLRDLLEEDPAQVVTVEGPNGPVTDTVEMLVGRLGLPELGGSYFTFSNENNDLIWGFLAECDRRGWLYKGIDSMPWCARCGTGMSQMEMNEGYQDREDPGLTVRFPLLERPGEALLVWTTTPWTMTANVAAAVGADLDYVLVEQGEARYWVGKVAAKKAIQGPFTVLEERKGADLVGWHYGGPFDDLEVPARAFAAGRDEHGAAPYVHRIIAWDEVGEEEGTSIVHIAPGGGAEDFQLGKQLGLPVIAPLDEAGHYLEGFGPFSGMDAAAVTAEIIEELEARGFYYHLEPYTHRYPHCWRCGTALLFRVVDEWYISMGPVYDVTREQVTDEQKTASLRYQIMDVVDQIRWFPAFGYERELDWLHTMSDWIDLQETLLGPGAAHLGVHRLRRLPGHRRAGGAGPTRQRRLRAARGPLAAPALGGRGRRAVPGMRGGGPPHPGRGQSLAGCRHRALQHAALPHGSRLLAEVVPGRLHHGVLPGPVPQLVLLHAGHGHRAAQRAALQGHLRLRHAVRRGRPAHAQVVGQRHRVQRGGRTHGRGRHALDVRQCTAGGQHPLRVPHRRRGPPRAAGALERAGLLHHLRTAGGLAAGSPGHRDAGARPGPATARPLDPLTGGGHGRAGGCRAGRVRHAHRDAGDQPLRGRPFHLVAAAQPAPPLAHRGRRGPGDRLRDAPPGTRERGAHDGTAAALPGRGVPPGPRGAGTEWRARVRASHELAGGGPGGPA